MPLMVSLYFLDIFLRSARTELNYSPSRSPDASSLHVISSKRVNSIL